MTPPKPMTEWQAATLPDVLPRHVRRNIVEGSGDCWLWSRACSPDGYGWASYQDRTWQAHRLAWVLINGSVPDGFQLDHLCRVRNCVNPAHLEPVTPGENTRRGEPANRTRCPSGHEYSAENTRIDRVGARNCRACARSRVAAYQKLRREVA